MEMVCREKMKMKNMSYVIKNMGDLIGVVVDDGFWLIVGMNEVML